MRWTALALLLLAACGGGTLDPREVPQPETRNCRLYVRPDAGWPMPIQCECPTNCIPVGCGGWDCSFNPDAGIPVLPDGGSADGGG